MATAFGQFCVIIFRSNDVSDKVGAISLFIPKFLEPRLNFYIKITTNLVHFLVKFACALFYMSFDFSIWNKLIRYLNSFNFNEHTFLG